MQLTIADLFDRGIFFRLMNNHGRQVTEVSLGVGIGMGSTSFEQAFHKIPGYSSGSKGMSNAKH
jgi:hypothetical protein